MATVHVARKNTKFAILKNNSKLIVVLLVAEYLASCHLIVEIPKTSPDEGKWIFLIAENWIQDHILFLPDNSYSAAHKIHLLKGGTHPDVENWDRHHTFEIIGKFGK